VARSGRRPLRLATRGSPLALLQAERVAEVLRAVAPDRLFEPVVVRTTGDRLATAPLAEIGGQGVFVKEVQSAVLDGQADLAVHSAKDLPPLTPSGLVLAAVPERHDPRDALVGCRLAALEAGATVATGSARRRAQLANVRPDLTFVDLRGNMDRRLARAGDGTVASVVVARAALVRLGLDDRVAEVLDPVVMLPQVGQGALAVECRADDSELAALLAAVDDPAAHRAVRAERALLAGLGAGCSVPVGGYATVTGGLLHLRGLVATGDGRSVVRAEADGEDPEELGLRLARALLDEHGARAILEAEGVVAPEGTGQ
jgi:hydroxymethylbilane synthase